MTREDYIQMRVKRDRAVGFDVTATADGIIYAADDFYGTPEIRMIAAACNCEGRNDGWHMEYESDNDH